MDNEYDIYRNKCEYDRHIGQFDNNGNCTNCPFCSSERSTIQRSDVPLRIVCRGCLFINKIY